MKPRALLLPLAAFFAAACLLVSQSRAISSVRERTARLRQQIAASTGNIAPASLATKSENRSAGKASINWLRLAELTGEQGSDGIFARQELLRAKSRIQAMSPADLLAALANVKTLGLDLRTRGEIDGLLITALGEKDPEAAMTYLSAPDNDHVGLSGNILPEILTAWTKSDLSAVLAWFDGQIAKGTFDNKSLTGANYHLFQIEGAVLANLLTSDPTAASRRLSAYSQDDRIFIFNQISSFNRDSGRPVDEDELVGRMILARETLATDAQSAAISKSMAPFSKAGDYEKIDHLLDRIAVSPAERAASITAAARDRFSDLSREDKLTSGEIDHFREWAASHSPTTVDRLTGETLSFLVNSRGNGWDPTAKVEELLFHYQETLGNDNVLMSYLETGPMWRDPDKTRVLAEKIKDPARREQFLASLKSQPGAP